MKLENEELILYFGCLDKAKTASDVAEMFYESKKDSVRSSISRKKAIQSSLEKGIIEARKEGTWVYKANENKLAEILKTLLKSREVSEQYKDLKSVGFDELDDGKIEELVTAQGFRGFYSEDKMKYILPDKLSKIRETLSEYSKMLFVILTGTKKLLLKLKAEGRLEDIKEGKVSFNKEKFSQLTDLASGMTFSDAESQMTIATVFRAISEVSGDIEVRQIPDVDNEEIDNIAEMSFMWVKYVIEDPKQLFKISQDTARA